MSQAQQLFSVEKIYLKDLSLEVPNAPQIFVEREAPKIDINLRSEARALEPGLFEVVLTATVTAKLQEKTVFLVEAAQAGIFQIRNVPEDQLEAVLNVVCGNVLFPYLRETISSAVGRAGFPPFFLAHVSFEALYQQRLAQERQATEARAAGAPPASGG